MRQKSVTRQHSPRHRSAAIVASVVGASALVVGLAVGSSGVILPGTGAKNVGIGLDNDWAVSILKAVGNYGESFERNLGQGSPLKIARGRNALWKDGGLMYAPPVR